jgi:glyoxylase-like metal-dependent hydrolase (beta-lactamase superfamily II)
MVIERITRILAPNPSPLTLEGTNTYFIDAGKGEAIVIDPGPDIPAHIDAIEAEAKKRRLKIVAIMLTHGHPDHAPAAEPLKRRTGARVFAHQNLKLPYDEACSDEERIIVGDIAVVPVDAPGHSNDHLVFWVASERALFTGDVILGRGTVVIAPPSGEMRPYQATLERLRDEFSEAAVIYGGHGDPVTDPAAKINEYIAHRVARERQVVEALTSGPQTIPELVKSIYATANPVVWPAAARQIMAYLIALEREGKVRSAEVCRPLNDFESTVLNPDLGAILEDGELEFVRTELALDDLPELRVYELTS